jgi:hypothetical protein
VYVLDAHGVIRYEGVSGDDRASNVNQGDEPPPKERPFILLQQPPNHTYGSEPLRDTNGHASVRCRVSKGSRKRPGAGHVEALDAAGLQ